MPIKMLCPLCENSLKLNDLRMGQCSACGASIEENSSREICFSAKEGFSKGADRTGGLFVTVPEDAKMLTIEKRCELLGFKIEKGVIVSARATLKRALIPDGVVGIGEGAFKNNTSLTEVIMPKSVKRIGKESFSSCTGLEDVRFPDEIEYIGEGAFEGCSALCHITLPKKITRGEGIGRGAFRNCQAIEEIALPESPRLGYTVYELSFAGCTSLKRLVIDTKDDLFIRENAFEGSLLEYVEMKNKRVSIYCDAFLGCPEGLTVNVRLYEDSRLWLYKGWDKLELGVEGKRLKWEINSCSNSKTVSGLHISEDCIYIKDETDSYLNLPKGPKAIGRIFSPSIYNKELIIPEGVEEIKDEVFKGCYFLKRVILPKSLKTIGDEAFSHCPELESIELPEGVTRIGKNAFKACKRLKSVELSTSLEYVGDGIFEDCDESLSIRLIGNGDINGWSKEWNRMTVFGISFYSIECENEKLKLKFGFSDFKVEERAFLGLKPFVRPEELVIPEGIEVIGENALAFVKDIKKVKLPSTLKVIRGGAFQFTDFEEIEIPRGVECIGEKAFMGCEKLRSIEIPERVCVISREMLRDCINLESIQLHDGIYEIGKYAFEGCEKIKKIKLPKSLGEISYGIFNGCRSLEELEIPRAVSKIDSAFDDCSSLKKIHIPVAVKKINNCVFSDCPSELVITVEGRTRAPKGFGGWWNKEGNDGYHTVIWSEKCIPEVMEEEAEAAGLTLNGTVAVRYNYNGDSTVMIPYGVTALSEGIFEGEDVGCVVLPESITEIPDRAFEGCEYLAGVVCLGKIERIGARAFYGCSGFKITAELEGETDDRHSDWFSTSILHIPEGVSEIGESAFEKCELIESIRLPKSVKTIEDRAFYGMESLRYIFLNSTVESLGQELVCVENCEIAVLVSGATDDIDAWEEAFCEAYVFDRYEEPTIEGFVQDDSYDSVISKTTLLKDIGDVPCGKIPDGVTEIADNAFRNCYYLQNVIIPKSVVKIGRCAFASLEAFKEVTIPSGVKSVGEFAFESCPDLERVTVEEGVLELEERVFWRCAALKALSLPSTLTKIGHWLALATGNELTVKINMTREQAESIAACGDKSLEEWIGAKNKIIFKE